MHSGYGDRPWVSVFLFVGFAVCLLPMKYISNFWFQHDLPYIPVCWQVVSVNTESMSTPIDVDVLFAPLFYNVHLQLSGPWVSRKEFNSMN
jgi:hypothetical protein